MKISCDLIYFRKQKIQKAIVVHLHNEQELHIIKQSLDRCLCCLISSGCLGWFLLVVLQEPLPCSRSHHVILQIVQIVFLNFVAIPAHLQQDHFCLSLKWVFVLGKSFRSDFFWSHLPSYKPGFIYLWKECLSLKTRFI